MHWYYLLLFITVFVVYHIISFFENGSSVGFKTFDNVMLYLFINKCPQSCLSTCTT